MESASHARAVGPAGMCVPSVMDVRPYTGGVYVIVYGNGMTSLIAVTSSSLHTTLMRRHLVCNTDVSLLLSYTACMRCCIWPDV